jgi:hypothetical protein
MGYPLRIVPVCCAALALLMQHAQGEEMRPNFEKLSQVAVFPAATEFARTNDIPITGIDPPAEGSSLNPGDSITALLTLFEKGGRRSQWLLWIEAAEITEKAGHTKPSVICYVGAGDKVEFSRAEAPLNLRLAGPFVDGTQKGKTPKVEDDRARVSVNQGFLGIGLDEAAAATYRIVQNHLHGGLGVRARPFTAAEIEAGRKSMAGLRLSLKEQRAIAGGRLALESYTTIVQETPGLDEIFYKVVKPPSLVSIIWHLGVKVNIELQQKNVQPLEPTRWQLLPGSPCFTYPLALRVNNQPALMTTLVVSPPRPPLLGIAGIVGMLAENPYDKETYLILQIVSAHRNIARAQPAPAKPQPASSP